MSHHIFRTLVTLSCHAILLTACASTTTTVYHGEMQPITVSGDACLDSGELKTSIPLELVMKRTASPNGQSITGYFSGADVQSGFFSGSELARLQVVYPDETDITPLGHTLALALTPDGMSGELHEKPQSSSTNCYFERALLSLKQTAVGNNMSSEFERQRTLFRADELFSRGQKMLTANNPGEALRDLTENLKIRAGTDRNDPKLIRSEVAVSIARAMAKQGGEAVVIFRNLLSEKAAPDRDALKRRSSIITNLCTYAVDSTAPEPQEAAELIVNSVAREFGQLEGVGSTLNECYRVMGQDNLEQGAPDRALDYFQRALALNPNDFDSIAGILISNSANETPAAGRSFLLAHAQTIIDKIGRDSYNAELSKLYNEEALQVAHQDKNYPRAEQLLREALTAVPGSQESILNLSRILERDSKPEEAVKLLESARNACATKSCRTLYTTELAKQEWIINTVKRLGH